MNYECISLHAWSAKVKWKKPQPEGFIICDSIDVRFWKRQNYRAGV